MCKFDNKQQDKKTGREQLGKIIIRQKNITNEEAKTLLNIFSARYKNFLLNQHLYQLNSQ